MIAESVIGILTNFTRMDIKEKIKRGVDEINNPQLLDELLKAVELEHEMRYIDELTDLEKRSIDEGISNAESGKVHSSAEASQLVKEWLKK